MKKYFALFSFFSFFALGNVNGYKVIEIEPQSLFAKIGLMKNDVIQKINGKSINSLNDLMEYMADHKTVRSAVIMREEEEMKLSFQSK